MPSRSQRSVSLKPYSPVAPSVVRSLTVRLMGINAGKLSLRYELNANLEKVRIPPTQAARATSRATDELWKHTCFEAFIRPAGGREYFELNVSPSTEWALYSFDDYRQEMTAIRPDTPPAIRVERGASFLQVHVDLVLGELPAKGNLALASVIELEQSGLTYWAADHRGTRPDFHHPDSFIVEL